MLIIGIDPGYEGAMAILDTATGKASVWATPVLKVRVDGKSRRQYLRKQMLRLLRTSSAGRGKQTKLVAIEEQHLFGVEGRKSAYSLGFGYALWLMCIDACKLPHIDVNIVDWKKALKLNSDKECSRLKALELFPSLAHDLRFKNSHGRAEALLLAYYCYREIILPQAPNPLDVFQNAIQCGSSFYAVKECAEL